MSSMYEYSSEGSASMRSDPLDALHDFHLRQHPDMDVSVLTDDELVQLLKRKDPKDLAHLNMNLTNSQTSDGGEFPYALLSRCLDVDFSSLFIGSVISLDSPTNSLNLSSSPHFSVHHSEYSQTSVSTANGSDDKANSQ